MIGPGGRMAGDGLQGEGGLDCELTMVPNPSSVQWYYGRNGVQHGPVSVEVLRKKLVAGELQWSDLVWREGLSDWQPASTRPELDPPTRGVFAPPPQAGQPRPPQSPPLGYQPPVPDPLQGKAVTSLVLGIVSIFAALTCCSPVGLVLGIPAIITGNRAMQSVSSAGIAKAGKVCGIIGTVIGGLASAFAALMIFAAVVDNL